MSMERTGSFLARGIEGVGKGLNMAASVCLFFLMMTVAADVFLRYLFNRPLLFAYDLGSLLMVPVVFLSLAWTMREERHVHVGIVIDRLGIRARALGYFFTSLLALPFFILFTWQTWGRAWLALELGHASNGYYEIPWWPFMMTISLGGLVISLQLMVRMVRLWRTATGGRPA